MTISEGRWTHDPITDEPLDPARTVAELAIEASPSFAKLKRAYESFLWSLEGTGARKHAYFREKIAAKISNKLPSRYLTAHAGVMNGKSARAITLRRLSHAVFAETGLPREPIGKFRGEDGVNWDKVEGDKA